jgi:hypothetical protein
MTLFGIDNGTSGTIGVWQDGSIYYYKTPVFKEKNFQKTVDINVTRIDTAKLEELLKKHITDEVHIGLERPRINPNSFNASLSAVRSLEATLIVIERLNLRQNLEFIDSKQWQKKYIPLLDGAKDLKQASWIKGAKMFPQFTDFKHPDRDGLFIMQHLKDLYIKD